MDAVLKELGSAHEGTIGVLLADGSEPGPVHFDVGSGPDTPSSTAWHAYDGRRGRPRAAALRGACSCGWRGMATYTLDWTRLKDRPLWEAGIDLCGPLADVGAHLSVVRDKAVPLPAPLTAVLTDLAAQLSQAAVQSPLVALKALADLRHVIMRRRPGRGPRRGVRTALLGGGGGGTRHDREGRPPVRDELPAVLNPP